MVGVICASGLLWLLHDLLQFSANQVILTLGAVTVLATVYAVYLLPGVFLRFLLCGVTHLMFRVRIVNAERLPSAGGALLVANHVSFADSMLLGCCTHRFIRFLMWARYYEMKPWKPIFRLLRAIPLRTESPRECVRALREARKELEAGELVCIFPEGALTRTGHVNPFQHGFERIVDGVNAPIIPIYLDGLWGHPLSLKNGTPGKWPVSFRRDVTVYIGEPVPAATSARELRQRVLELSSRAAQLRKNEKATLAHRFVQSAKSNWSANAIADSTGKQMTFGETLTAALLFRDWLDQKTPNQPYVGVLLPSSVAGAIANLGITLAGRAAVNLNFTTGEEGMQAAIAKCGLKTIFTSPRFLEKAKITRTPAMIMVEDAWWQASRNPRS